MYDSRMYSIAQRYSAGRMSMYPVNSDGDVCMLISSDRKAVARKRRLSTAM